MKTLSMPTAWKDQLESEGVLVMPYGKHWDALLLTTDGLPSGQAIIKSSKHPQWEAGEVVKIQEGY
jgi:hypothetical protein